MMWFSWARMSTCRTVLRHVGCIAIAYYICMYIWARCRTHKSESTPSNHIYILPTPLNLLPHVKVGTVHGAHWVMLTVLELTSIFPGAVAPLSRK